jgi:hypothetical protein
LGVFLIGLFYVLNKIFFGFVASKLLDNLYPYQYIFLDSVNKLGLSADDLTAFRKKYPQKSFVFIFQTTKDGNFRGANSFQSAFGGWMW